MNISIAIDGPASSGKSSIAKCIADRFNFKCINTGLLYRLATYISIDENIDFVLEESRLIDKLKNAKIDIHSDYLIYNGLILCNQLRTQDIDSKVSLLSTRPAVRRLINEILRYFKSESGIVMDGRDIGTEVLKDASLKFFIVADPEIRARRRYDQLIKIGIDTEYKKILNEIEKRDNIDYNKEEGPLKKANDAKVIDTSNLNFQESVDEVSRVIVEYMVPKMKFKS